MNRTAIIVLVVAVGSMGAGEPKDKFTEYFEKLGAIGPRYRNCGRVTIDGNREQADACVLEAFAAKKAFLVRYDKLGIDSNVADGLMFSADKQLTVVHFDDWFCSTPYCLRFEPCNSAKITRAREGIHVQCINEYDL